MPTTPASGPATTKTLGEQASAELDRVMAQDGCHVDISAGKEGIAGEVEAELPRNWSVGAYARYYWNKTWDAAVRLTKKW